MKLEQALVVLKDLCGQNLAVITDTLPPDLITNKGHVGQLLELYLGLKLGTSHTDFEDGELKTNKTKADGKPAETIYVTQVASQIDKLLSPEVGSFDDSLFFLKITRLVIVQVIKVGPEANWRFGHVYFINLASDQDLKEKLRLDYDSIRRQLREHILNSQDGFIHTSSGEYVQIRSKDSKPYHPIFSAALRRMVSDKNHAFYFKKDFMLYLQERDSLYRVCQH